ncbi:kinase-like domain-containing protein [Cladochytrium replicatum]|nr:kinase-like domain-containing protein [Cladochytrium replicatum]
MSGKKTLSKSFCSRYRIGDLLGDGAFGFVLTATRLADRKEVAVKFIIRQKVPRELWVNDDLSGKVPLEIQILMSLDHPNIIKYLEHIHEKDYILLITELHGTPWDVAHNRKLNPTKHQGLRPEPRSKAQADTEKNSECSPLFRLSEEQEKKIRRRTSCDLFECIDHRFPEFTASCIFKQIANAVSYMHRMGIVHRDLKDENIVVDEDYNIKIIDFGSASRIPNSKEEFFTKFNGTAHFASPQIVQGYAYRGPEAEVWTLGVLLFTVCFGENPFQTREDIIKGIYKIPFRYNVGKSLDLQ